MAWKTLDTAPRDGKPVWLFLPSAKYELDAQRRPFNVEHLTVTGHWDKTRMAWLAEVDSRTVYPSCWSDAPIDGAAPASPV